MGPTAHLCPLRWPQCRFLSRDGATGDAPRGPLYPQWTLQRRMGRRIDLCPVAQRMGGAAINPCQWFTRITGNWRPQLKVAADPKNRVAPDESIGKLVSECELFQWPTLLIDWFTSLLIDWFTSLPIYDSISPPLSCFPHTNAILYHHLSTGSSAHRIHHIAREHAYVVLSV